MYGNTCHYFYEKLSNIVKLLSQKFYNFSKCTGFQYFRQLLKELVQSKENHEEKTPENQITIQSSGRRADFPLHQ